MILPQFPVLILLAYPFLIFLKTFCKKFLILTYRPRDLNHESIIIVTSCILVYNILKKPYMLLVKYLVNKNKVDLNFEIVTGNSFKRESRENSINIKNMNLPKSLKKFL